MSAPAAAPLPVGFAVRLAPGTRRRNAGAALLGGSPLRLLHLAPRARALLADDRLVVTDGPSAALAGRLLDSGVAVPDLPSVAPEGLAGAVTVVVPVRDRTAELDRLLRTLRNDPATASLPLVVVDDGSADAAALAAVAESRGALLLRHQRARGPAAARNAGLRLVGTELVAFLDSDCVPVPGWLAVLAAHLADPTVALVAPRIVPLQPSRGWLSGYEAAASCLDMGASPAPVRPLSRISYVPSAALLARRAALGAGFDETMRVAEDVDLVWRLDGAGWRVRYEPAARVAHEHPERLLPWLRRRAFYGTGAALLAARHGAAVAPVVMSPWSAAVWALLVAGGGRWARPAWLGALAVLGSAVVGLARRLRRPGERPPLVLAGRLVVGGTAMGGCTLARAATRHHWPLALLAALVSRRARRWGLLAAGGDALLAWWPHRRQVGLPAFALARRLEDLAYGVGLWRGAFRARSLRALFPARPPTGSPRRYAGGVAVGLGHLHADRSAGAVGVGGVAVDQRARGAVRR